MTAPTLDHTEPIGPQPEPAPSGPRPAVQRMFGELDARFKGADCGTVGEAVEEMKKHSANPNSWGSQGQAGQAVKAYKERYGIPTKPAPAKKPARTAPPKPRRTAAVRPEPTPVVQANPAPVVRQPVPTPTAVVQTQPVPRSTVRSWPVMVIALPAMVAIWSGWVGLGGLTGFGVVHPLPGIADSLSINTAITLPIGVEAYAAYAMRVWLSGHGPARARRFAKWSAIGSLVVGALGQVAYHVLVAFGVQSAPWQITTLVACLPVAVVGMAAALHHLCTQEA